MISTTETASHIRLAFEPDRRSRLILSGAALLSLGLFFLIAYRRLSFSLWLDESLTTWAISGGVLNIVERVTTWLGQSPVFYVFEGYIVQGFGNSELALRVLPLLATVITGALIYFFARERIGNQSALLATCLYFSSPQMLFYATNARPYSIGAMFAVVSIYSALLLVEGRGIGVWYVIATSITLYFHFLFILIIPIHLVIFLTYGGVSFFKRLWALGIAIGLLSFPLVLQGRNLAAHKFKALSYPYPLTWAQSGVFDKAAVVILLIAVSFALARVLRGKSYLPHLFALGKFGAICLVWWLAVPMLLYSLYVAVGTPLFFERFYMWCLPGQILFLSQLSTIFMGQKRLPLVAFTVLAVNLLQYAPLMNRREDWREAIEFINHAQTDSTDLVFFYPGHIELADPTFLRDPEKVEIMTSLLLYYPINSKVVLIPRSVGISDLDRYVATNLDQAKNYDRIWLLFRRFAPDYGIRIIDALRSQGFKYCSKTKDLGLKGVKLGYFVPVHDPVLCRHWDVVEGT